MTLKPGRLRAVLRVGAAAGAALAGLALLTGRAAAPDQGLPARAPDFTLTQTSTHDTLVLSDYSAQPVLLFFYDGGDMRSWSAIPYVNEMHRRYAGDGLAVVGVHWSRHEPLRLVYNAIEVVSARRVTYPVGLDLDGSVHGLYGLTDLPAYYVLRPGLEIAYATSGPKPYALVETAIQELLRQMKPGIIHPFLVKPLSPLDDPARTILRATPAIDCGYLSGAVADCDSTRYDRPFNYFDSWGRDKGKIYLNGYWTVGPNSMSHEAKYASSEDRLRIIYSGKEVWLLPSFPYGQPQRVYVKQDKSYLDRALWGKAIIGDETGRPYILMRYSIPTQVVSNKSFGSHELELIPAEGDVAFCYLFFEDGVAE